MTVSTIRPNATDSNTGALTGGATAHAVLSDNSDSTYVEYDPAEESTLQFGDFTLPSGALVKRIAVRLRSLAPQVKSVLLRATLSVGDDDHEFNGAVSWQSITETTIGYVDAQYTETEVDALTVQLLNSNSTAQYVDQVTELYVDVTYVEQPVVLVVTPSGSLTSTNRPTVSWTRDLDSDGGSQTFYEVRVFDSTQYGAGGFDPSVDAATDESGITSGAVSSWSGIDEALTDGTTYRAYVRVAQSAGDAVVWSAWNYGEFTVNVPTPPKPTSVTVTTEASNGRIQLVPLEASGGGTITQGFVFQRSTDGGLTWEDVRVGDDLETLLRIPSVVEYVLYSDSADGTSHIVNLPTGIQEGDLLLALGAMDGNPGYSWPVGWIELFDANGPSNAVRGGGAYKFAQEGESGTLTVTTSASEGGGILLLVIRGHHETQAPSVSSNVNATTSTPDPPDLNPGSWATENTLWIASVAFDGDVSASSIPTGYRDKQTARWANASGAGRVTAVKRSEAANEDPGTFTLSASEETSSRTIGIRPSQPTPLAYDYEAPNNPAVQYRVAAYSEVYDSYSLWRDAAASVSWESAAWWLKHPFDPTLNMVVVPRSQPTRHRVARSAKHRVLGRSTPVVLSDVRESWEGELVLRLDTQAEQDDLDALLAEMVPLLLQAPGDATWDDTWIVIDEQARTRVIDASWSEPTFDSLPWTEVDRPEGALY